MTYSFLALGIMSVVTFSTRLLPFLLFGGKKKPPKPIVYLGTYLPPAIIAMLVVYFLKDTTLTAYPFGLPEAIAVLSVVGLHVWKRNNLISIFGGTLLYMLLTQLIFI